MEYGSKNVGLEWNFAASISVSIHETAMQTGETSGRTERQRSIGGAGFLEPADVVRQTRSLRWSAL